GPAFEDKAFTGTRPAPGNQAGPAFEDKAFTGTHPRRQIKPVRRLRTRRSPGRTRAGKSSPSGD
ncbi:hypothetical protein AB0N93_01275, partial [Streptomyces sp. NPDC091267]|uniref:hypothetical protein n=1 Tax=unclassified Streptomyces TaxID=2593676 RepID=UPI0034439A63